MFVRKIKVPLVVALFVSQNLRAVELSEAELAIRGFEIPQGFKCELVAGDTLLANPVAFTIDERGRFFIAETFRFNAGVPDIRGRMHWLDTELAVKSVAERVAYTKRFEPTNLSWWTNKADRISILWDSNGDGQLDQTKIFAGGFNDFADGLGSGVLAWQGNVYFANIPHLWLLADTNRDDTADFKKSLSYGYGVRYGFIGHDLHGLIIGPDGRLYFSIGDRGANVILANGKQLDNSESGCVFRCELDGSNLEVFYIGLRNPQELAFDNHGNLWTVDNNSDAGDPARVVYLAEGGDSGWRIGWQFIEQPIARSSWLGERLCYENFPERAAYALPPVSSKVGNGPSGLTFDPGTGFPSPWREKFFLANFSGSPSPNSGVFAFSVKPQGAGFELEHNEKFWWKFLPTDVDFGYDGCLYATDWINGWEGTGKGRIYRLYQPEERNQPVVAQVKKLFAEGFEQRPNAELVKLLAHADRRVRQEAQFALVAHKATRELAHVAAFGPRLFSRLHAIWGLGQLERAGKKSDFKKLLADPQPEVRAQAAKVLGDANDSRFEKQLIQMLSDAEPRPRYFAALALGKIASKKSVSAVSTMLRQSGDDPWLRHAGVMALMGCASEKQIAALAGDSSVNVRRAGVVALRQLASPKLENFLADPEPRVVAEAARAINDLPVQAALPALAELADKRSRFAQLPAGTKEQPTSRDAILRRIVNANFRLGTPAAAARLAEMAADESLPEFVRGEAIGAFTNWQKPDGKDHVSGLWRQLPERAAPDFVKLKPSMEKILAGRSSSKIQADLLTAAGELKWSELSEPALALQQKEQSPSIQVAALEFFDAINSPKLPGMVSVAVDSKSEEVRIAAVKLAAKSLKGEQLSAALEKISGSGTTREQQNVYQILGNSKDAVADDILAKRLDDLLAGKIPGEFQLDLLDAAAARSNAQVMERLAKFQASRASQTGIALFTECLSGGNAEKGRKIFRENAQASCLRCHKIKNEGGEAAPDLTKIASRADRNHILESITFPNAKIAGGFENIQVSLESGSSHVGIVKRETADELDLLTLDDGLVKIKKPEIKLRVKTQSGMPENLRDLLTRREIRDLVEYLASLK